MYFFRLSIFIVALSLSTTSCGDELGAFAKEIVDLSTDYIQGNKTHLNMITELHKEYGPFDNVRVRRGGKMWIGKNGLMKKAKEFGVDEGNYVHHYKKAKLAGVSFTSDFTIFSLGPFLNDSKKYIARPTIRLLISNADIVNGCKMIERVDEYSPINECIFHLQDKWYVFYEVNTAQAK